MSLLYQTPDLLSRSFAHIKNETNSHQERHNFPNFAHSTLLGRSIGPAGNTHASEVGLRLPAFASLTLASCWPRPQQQFPASATGGGRCRCRPFHRPPYCLRQQGPTPADTCLGYHPPSLLSGSLILLRIWEVFGNKPSKSFFVNFRCVKISLSKE